MTLTLVDEFGKPVTETAPLVTEHNGTEGETVDRILALRNEARGFRYEDLAVLAEASEGVTVYVGLRKADLAARRNKLTLDKLGPNANHAIHVRVIVHPGHPEAVIKTTAFNIKAMKYPVQ